jgi:uncharacterized protein
MRFWEKKTLDQLTLAQWEVLCDGCGRCCLQKLKHPTTGKVDYTSVACRLLDLTTCRCTAYSRRRRLVRDCLELKPAQIFSMNWLPRTCAYRLIAQGKPLPEWHPLISGDPESVHRAGISIRHKALSETDIEADQLENYLLPQRL